MGRISSDEIVYCFSQLLKNGVQKIRFEVELLYQINKGLQNVSKRTDHLQQIFEQVHLRYQR